VTPARAYAGARQGKTQARPQPPKAPRGFWTQTAPGSEVAQSLLAPQPQEAGARSPQKLRPAVVTQQAQRSPEPARAQSVRTGGEAPALLAIVQIP